MCVCRTIVCLALPRCGNCFSYAKCIDVQELLQYYDWSCLGTTVS